jgi:hypothetical protein
MIYVGPGLAFEASAQGFAAGLTGIIGVRIMDGQGATTTARSTSGIVESPGSSGIYVATLTAPTTAGQYLLVWDTGTVAVGTTAVEDLTVTSTAPGFLPGTATGWEPDYITAAQLKSAVRILDTNDDAELGFAISAASRAIDDHTDRQFGLLATPATRYYSGSYDDEMKRWVVYIDDLMTTTDLVVKTDDGTGAFATTIALNTDARLAPYNAPADGKPWTKLVAGPTTNCSTLFTREPRSIEITARWGWAAVPVVVTQACLIQAARFFKRKDAPFGVTGSPELGSELRLLERLDPDVALLLNGLVRRRWRIPAWR